MIQDLLPSMHSVQKRTTTVDLRSCESKRVLLVDPDEAFGTALKRVLGGDYLLSHVGRVENAIPFLHSDEIDVVLLNWDQPSRADHSDCLALLGRALELGVSPPVLGFSWDMRRESALEAMKQGLWDFFLQPLDVLTLKFALDRAYKRMMLSRDLIAARKLISVQRVKGLIGNSKPMERVYEMIHKVAGVLTTVLLSGESGTGKEVVARAIHRSSPRVRKPFVAFSAASLPESLIETELFGYEKGAFSGASQTHVGLFEAARGGTIFIDEIGDLALPVQAKLLRVLQERSLQRLGSSAPIPLDIRVICATSQDLEQMVQAGTFRQDLYFRISVLKIELPPLRNRMDDIPVLAEYFLRSFASAHGKGIRKISPGFMSALASHAWPGNVRELQNLIERSVVLADGVQLGIENLPAELSGVAAGSELTKGAFQEAVRSFKRELVRSALRMCNGNKLKAAQELQISRCYLHRLLNQLNIEDDLSIEEELAVEEEPVPSAQAD
jgi:two-component system, NtrC family, response regulator HydG